VSEQYANEQRLVRELIEHASDDADEAHLGRYLEEWERLKGMTRGERV
jgi:DNA-binding phage protein